MLLICESKVSRVTNYGERKPKVIKHLLKLCSTIIILVGHFSRLKDLLVDSKLNKKVYFKILKTKSR